MQLIKNIFLAVLALVVITSCSKEPELGPEPNRFEGLSGSWTLQRVVQVDFTDPANRTRDISRFFLAEDEGTNQVITFNRSDRSFTVSEGAKGPNLLGESGTWSFDDERFPTRIVVSRNGDVSEWRLNGPARPQDRTLRFSVVNQCDGDDYVGYRFEFNRN
jgi:hypothetical protein